MVLNAASCVQSSVASPSNAASAGRYRFFSRRWGATWDTTTAADVFGLDARVLERLR